MKNCNKNILNFCQLVDEDWKDRIITFYSDISQDDFILEIEVGFLKNKKTLTLGDGLTRVQNTLIIEDPELNIGRYPYKLIRINEGTKRVLLSGYINVVETHADDCDCGCACEIFYDVFEGIVNVQGATIDVDSTITVEPDEPAKVENVGTSENVVLKFYIPRGEKGEKGDSIEIDWEGTKLGVRIEGQPDYQYVDLKGEKGDNLEFTWRGTELGVRVEGEEEYQYVNLRGDTATVKVGTVTSLPPESSPTVVNSGDENDAIFNFGIPKGEKGDTGNAATIEVGNTVTVEPDQPAKVSNSGDENDAVLDFNIPKGDPFTYDDFTEEQIEELQKPALDAAEAAYEAIDEITEAVHNAKWYGIEWDVTNSSPDVTRIGDLALHRSLPVQNRMVGALVGDDRKVVEYLSPNDWDAHDLTGARGQVMVRIPEHYYKFETDGDIRRAKISEFPLPGFHRFKPVWHGAYEASTYRPDNKLASVVNASPDYRGGDNNDANDEAPNSLLGMPRTATSRISFNTAAKNRGADWNQVWYEVRKQLFWLFAIEYATFHSQKAVNTELDGNGFRQGGLGDGITTVASADWSSYNSYYPFVPCGTSNELGNGSGEVAFELPEEFEGTTRVVYANRYRGIENPFGHIYEWLEGVNIQVQADDEGDGVSRLWVCDDPDNFQDDNYEGYEMRGLLPRENGYIQEVLFGEKGDILPSVTGGGSTTYFTDRFYTSIPESGESLRGLYSGGSALTGVPAGFVFSSSSYAPTSTLAYRGSRLCCYESVSE